MSFLGAGNEGKLKMEGSWWVEKKKGSRKKGEAMGAFREEEEILGDDKIRIPPAKSLFMHINNRNPYATDLIYFACVKFI